MRIRANHLPHKDIFLKIPDISSLFLYGFFRWEPELQYFIESYIGDGDVIEIGAHIGYQTVYMAEKIRKNKKVIAFEPSPKTQLLLEENCSQFKNIEIIAKAVSDETRKSEILTFNLWSAWNTLGNKARFPRLIETFLSPQKATISQITLDDFISSRNDIKPSFIKIDAENFEYQVLKGAQKTINFFKPVITFEGGDLNRDPKYSTEKILEIIKSYNYKVYIYDRKLKKITSTLPSDFSKCVNFLALPS